MPSARFPNQIHEIRATKLQIYPFALVISTQLLLKATFRLEKAGVCPTGFEATFAATFALFYCLREFVLSLVTNSFELRSQSAQLLLLYYKICHC